MKYNNFNFLTCKDVDSLSMDYKQIASIVSDMARTGALFLSTGHCISSANMIYTALKQKGINSKIVEVETTICNVGDDGAETFFYMGFDNIASPGEIDTHVVVITETNPPYIIDASISNKIRNRNKEIIPVIIEPVEKELNRLIGNFKYFDEKLLILYREKINQKDAISFQKSILDRIETDAKFTSEINLLKTLNYIGIFLSTFSLLNILLKYFGYLA